MSSTTQDPTSSDLVGALAQAIGQLQADDPFSLVTVVVPTNHSGTYLRRAVGASRAIGNVVFITLHSVADQLSRTKGRSIRPSAETEREALRTALRKFDRFRSLAKRSEALDEIATTMRELRMLGTDGRERLVGLGGSAAALVQLSDQFGAALEQKGFGDRRSVTDRAIASLADGDPVGLGSVVLADLGPLSQPETALVEAIIAAVEHRVVSVVPEPIETPRAVRCADPDEEVRFVIGEIVASTMAGVGQFDHVIVHPGGSLYPRLIAQHCRAAGLTVTGESTRTLQSTAPARFVAAFLEVVRTGWGRQAVADWFSSAPIRQRADSDTPINAAYWLMLAKQAGITAGQSIWLERLEVTDHDLRGFYERQVESLDLLASFMTELFEFDLPSGRSSWSTITDRLTEVIARYFLVSQDTEMAESLEMVTDVLAHLATLDQFGSSIDVATFAGAFKSSCGQTPLRTSDTFGHGVFVTALGATRGLRADTVFIVGAADSQIPGPARGALVSDAERLVADDPALPARRLRLERAETAWQGALAIGRRRQVVTAPRIDPRTGRELTPSRWLTATVECADTTLSFEAGARRSAPVSETQLRLRHLLTNANSDVIASDPVVAAGVALVSGRESVEFTRYDGDLSDVAAQLALDRVDEPVSPTRLETWAHCPRKYFFASVLKLHESEEPEDRFAIKPTERGSLIHGILETYIRDRMDNGLGPDYERLIAIAQQYFDDAQAQGITGNPFSWRREKFRIERELRRFYDGDIYEPLAAELHFGGGEGEYPPVEIVLSDHRIVRFQGKIDRVDRTESGQLVVSDYKTGRESELVKALKTDPVDRGRRLQLAVYARAARLALAPAARVFSRYWLLSLHSGDNVTVGGEVDAAVDARLDTVVEQIAGGIEAGIFPGVPGDDEWNTFANCKYCEFTTICPANRDQSYVIKMGSPRLKPFRELNESPADAELEGRMVASELTSVSL